MKRKVGKALGEAIILLVVSVFGIVMSILSHNSFNVEWKLSPYLFPLLISVFLLVLSIFLLIHFFPLTYMSFSNVYTGAVVTIHQLFNTCIPYI